MRVILFCVSMAPAARCCESSFSLMRSSSISSFRFITLASASSMFCRCALSSASMCFSPACFFSTSVSAFACSWSLAFFLFSLARSIISSAIFPTSACGSFIANVTMSIFFLISGSIGGPSFCPAGAAKRVSSFFTSAASTSFSLACAGVSGGPDELELDPDPDPDPLLAAELATELAAELATDAAALLAAEDPEPEDAALPAGAAAAAEPEPEPEPELLGGAAAPLTMGFGVVVTTGILESGVT